MGARTYTSLPWGPAVCRVTLFHSHPVPRAGSPGWRRVVGARAVGTPRAQVRGPHALPAEAEPGASRRPGPAGLLARAAASLASGSNRNRRLFRYAKLSTKGGHFSSFVLGRYHRGGRALGRSGGGRPGRGAPGAAGAASRPPRGAPRSLHPAPRCYANQVTSPPRAR